MAVLDFLYSTDYTLDKAVYLNSVSFTIPTPTAGYFYTIAHGLPFTPLVGGSWSTSSDFLVTYDFGSGVIPSSNIGASLFDYSLEIAADSTNIYIIPTNVSGATKTVYVRVFGIEPSDSTATLPHTASSGDVFAFSTDYNYTKPYEASKITGLASSSTTTITHSLEYVPQVTAWATNSARTFNSVFFENVTYPIYVSDFSGGSVVDVSVEATTTTAIFKTGSSSNTNRFDYVIYYDPSGGTS